MDKLSAVISFIKEKRKILASLFLSIAILSAILDGVILIQRPKTFHSKAANLVVVFKNSSQEVLPTNKEGLPISNSLEVVVELNPVKIPQFYKITENPSEFSKLEQKSFEPPVKFAYKFQNVQNKKATLFVEFLYPDNTTQRVVSSVEIDALKDTADDFLSPKGYYKILYDQKRWSKNVETEEAAESKVVFNLNKEYGFARLDVREGESEKDLDSLKDEVVESLTLKPASVESVQFKDKPSYLLSYKEKILGEDTFYTKQIVKNNNKFFVFEKRASKFGSDFYLENLLGNISFGPFNKAEVKGVSDAQDQLTTVELIDLVRPSIANIVHVYCLDIVNLAPSSLNSLQQKYNFCNFAKGSGFVVNEKGIIATNGHVAKIYPEEALVTNILYGGNKMFAMDLIKEIYSSAGNTATTEQIEDLYNQASANPQYIDRFLSEIFKLLDKKMISIGINNENFYVNVGDEPVRIDNQKVIPSSTTYSAKLLGFNYPNKYSYDTVVNKKYQLGSDVALLEIKNSYNNLFPTLELGSIENLKEGSDVVIAGYPVLVEGWEGPQAAISYKTSTKPTVTRGIVSAIKQDPSGRKVVQTDASIDHGNSGGPAFNLLGQVIGIATFFFESKSGNFNFLRDVSDLRELMVKNNVDNKLGNLTLSWREGLAKFRNKHYKQAIKHFEEVEKLSKSHPSAKEFIALSKKAIEKGESQEGFIGFIKSGQASNSMLVIFGAVSVVSFMLAGFLMVLPLFERRESF